MPSHDDVQRRAYELYEERGRSDGHDWDDWLEAERELRAREATGDRSAAAEGARPADSPRRRRKDTTNAPAAL